MRSFVILGIILIIGSIVGTKWAFDHQSPSPKVATEAEANKPPDKIICWGFFDVEAGVGGLDPRQFGDILEVAAENTPVKKGDVLLHVNDRLAKLKIEEAKADIKASEQQVAEARHLTEFYDLQKKQQKFAISAINHKMKGLRLEERTQLDTLDKKQPIYQTIQDGHVVRQAELADLKKVEETKLKQLELHDASIKILQAEADLEAKKVRLKQAEEILTHFQVLAPSDGTVLRVHVRKGETLGPNPLKHAIDFLPDAEIIVRAEVLQEWGRFIKENQQVEIEDDTYNGPSWKGEVKKLSKWYAPVRSPVIEPLRYNDVRTMECIIRVSAAANAKIGQRVRAKVIVN